MKALKELLTQNGFTPADQTKDFGCVIPYVHYYYKKSGSLYQYVSLVTYSPEFVGKTAKEMLDIEGEFVEAVYELFMAEKNTYRPKGTPKQSELLQKGFNVVHGGLPRSLEDLTPYVTKTDAELKELADKMYAGVLLLEKQKKNEPKN